MVAMIEIVVRRALLSAVTGVGAAGKAVPSYSKSDSLSGFLSALDLGIDSDTYLYGALVERDVRSRCEVKQNARCCTTIN